ncbi:MAG: hypothetical protein HND42_05150 [Armatimonadetes bacterium]|nr:hypothetical protein [Armatimonadota bacterium]NOG92612.1 hypothetical protein [Armatimonadota bacterium]
MIWRSVLLAVLCGFSSVVLFYDAPTLYYQGLGFGLSWSYETAQSAWKPAGVFTALLIMLGCAGPGRLRRAFITAGVVAHITIRSFGGAIGKDLEQLPPTLGDLGSAFIGSAPQTAVNLTIVFIVAYGLALLGRALRKWILPQRPRGNPE